MSNEFPGRDYDEHWGSSLDNANTRNPVRSAEPSVRRAEPHLDFDPEDEQALDLDDEKPVPLHKIFR